MQKKPDYTIVSKFLQQKLKEKGVTTNELAERMQEVDISRAAIYFYVNGQRVPAPPILRLICRALGVSLSEIPEYEMKPAGRPKKMFPRQPKFY